MAWPFSSVLAPNVTSGNVTVPTSSTSIQTGTVWLLGANFSSAATVLRTVTITDTAGVVIATFDLTPGSPVSMDWAFLPTNGVKWFASGASVTGHIWGYT